MEEINETLELSKSCNKAVNQVIELAKRVKDLEILVELLYYKVQLNDEQQQLLDSIISEVAEYKQKEGE